jgi:hypothetical protein
MESTGKSAEFIEMRFGPRWPYVSAIRNFIQNFLSIAISNQKQADQIAMSVSELVENAVKYSDDTETYLKINLLAHDHNRIEVIVKNHAKQDQAESLVKFVNEINSLPPLESYMDRMRKSVELDISQLGLARIRYEAGAELKAQYENSTVTVNATFGPDN